MLIISDLKDKYMISVCRDMDTFIKDLSGITEVYYAVNSKILSIIKYKSCIYITTLNGSYNMNSAISLNTIVFRIVYVNNVFRDDGIVIKLETHDDYHHNMTLKNYYATYFTDKEVEILKDYVNIELYI